MSPVQTVKLFHRTTIANARSIQRTGFRDGRGSYMTRSEHSGVWLSNVPLDENEGAIGDALLSLEIDEARIASFEWLEVGKPYREWLVPAAVINSESSSLTLEVADKV